MITKHTCPSGVRILLEKIPTVRSATIGIWIGTGSRHETETNNGISHFIEHMLFKGTTTRSARDIAESFDQIGGQVNAFTSKEYTCYYAKVIDEHTLYAVDVLSDMLFNSTFNEDEIKKEKQVISEEIKMYDDTPDDIVHDLLSEASYGHHPLGYPILGVEKTLNQFSPEDIKSYMDEYYCPNNIVISLAGNIDESIIPSIEAIFSDYGVSSKTNHHEPPIFYSGRIGRKKATEQAHVCLGFNGISNDDERVYPLIVMNNILGGSMSSRLFQEVREERGLAYSIFSYHTSYKDSGLLTIYGGTGADQLDQLSETVFATLDDLVKKGVSEKELRNSKEQLKGNLLLSLESTSSRMSRNAKNELILGRHRPMDEMTAMINEVTLSDVHDIAKKIFDQEFSCSVVSPTGELPQSMQNE